MTVLTFEHGIAPTNDFSWQKLLAQGDDLLMSILRLKDYDGVSST